MILFTKEALWYRKKPDPINPDRFLKDDYGRFIHETQTINVAIDLRVNVVRDREGAEVQSFMSVDYPPDLAIDYGDELEYIDELGRSYRGYVISIEENTDPLGIRTLSRFANIGYQ